MRPSLWRALITASTALTALSGCEAQTSALDVTEDEGVTGQVRSAATATYYDFIVNAPGAAWHNNDTGLSWGTNDSSGACYTATGILENGVSSPYLFTQPKAAADGFMHATYTVTIPAASLHPSVTATFGFKQGASGTDGVTFGLLARIDGNWVTLFSQTKSYTGTLTTKTADLSTYGGQTLQLFLIADAGATATNDFGAWTDFRLIADTGGIPNGGCTIGGANYEIGAANPAVSCQVCDPSASTNAWSIRGDSCFLDGQCRLTDAQDSLGCRRCDPLVSQTSWTNQTVCDKIVLAVTNANRQGNFLAPHTDDPRPKADAICAADGAALGLPGTWRAAISLTGIPSGSGEVPFSRDYRDAVPSSQWSIPVVNLHGEEMYASWSAIFSNEIWPTGRSMYRFNDSAYTGKVWTASKADGTIDGTNHCLYFASPFGNATAGDFSQRRLLRGSTSTTSLAGCNTSLPMTCVLTPSTEGQVTVQNYDGTALGTLQGKPHNDAYAWRGIPYAAAPTGNLRLAPPAKATAWSGLRNAFDHAPPCPQPPLLPVGGMIGSEDCLYLNVWAPKTATATSNLPVLVFHHGGAHMFGGTKSSDDWLAAGFIDGDRFAAAQNAIVVTIQTRLGPLGYMTDAALAANSTSRTSTVGGGTSGNYGLLDNIQALKWIKRNISKFGGDPTKVAFSGQSSGATMVCDLLASPLAKDPADNQPYFTSAIIESGFCEGPSVAYRQAQATSAISSIGCGSAPDKVACLRSASLQSFVNVEGPILGFFPALFGSATPPERVYGLTWGPHIDGYVLPQQPRVSFAAGTHNKVPVIVGTNKEEATFFMLFMVGGILTGDLPNLIVLAGCGARDTKVDINLGTTLANSVKSLYSCNNFDLLSPTKSYAEGVTQLQYECPARRTARALDIGQTQPVRRYWFVHRADHWGIFHNLLGLVRDIGASHTFELPFVFNSHRTMLGYWPSTRERALTTTLQTYWRNFANSGDPNYTGGVNWTAYDRALDNAAKLEVAGSPGGIQMVNGVNTAKCDFWDNNFTLDGWK